MLELVELKDRQNDKFRTYSLGMKQRLAIASALLNDPTVLILDEPTNGLDPMGIAEIRGLIKKIAADGRTIILASHLLDEVQKVCSHFAVLKRGVLMYSGPVDVVGEGEIKIEVESTDAGLREALSAYEGTVEVERAGSFFEVRLREGHDSAALNRYLFNKGITVNHLVTHKKTLEEQFLEILSDSSPK